MHERALMADLIRKVQETAVLGGAERVTCIEVHLGALSHFTPEHFREHFVDASHGTLAEGAEVIATLDEDISAPHASDVVLDSVEVEVPDAVERA